MNRTRLARNLEERVSWMAEHLRSLSIIVDQIRDTVENQSARTGNRLGNLIPHRLKSKSQTTPKIAHPAAC
jgi:hypothetical protein